MQQSDKINAFPKSFKYAFLADPLEGNILLRWDYLRDIIYSTTLRDFGRK